MNRLTERLPNGVVRAPVTDENRGDSCMMRLAAYEDTGLAPGEIAELVKLEAVKSIADAADMSLVRIGELAAADKDGSVVVML